MNLFVKLDVRAITNAKLLTVGPLGFALYVKGLCYAKEHMTDGVIPSAALPLIGLGIESPQQVASALVAAGLWEECEGGWTVGGDRWAEHQTTREQVESRRDAEAERKRKYRMSRRDTSETQAESSVDSLDVSRDCPAGTDADAKEMPSDCPAVTVAPETETETETETDITLANVSESGALDVEFALDDPPPKPMILAGDEFDPFADADAEFDPNWPPYNRAEWVLTRAYADPPKRADVLSAIGRSSDTGYNGWLMRLLEALDQDSERAVALVRFAVSSGKSPTLLPREWRSFEAQMNRQAKPKSKSDEKWAAFDRVTARMGQEAFGG